MDLTVHILTKNNEKTIEKAINSLKPLNCHIVVADMGSSDQTIQVARSLKVETTWMPLTNYSELRNRIADESNTEWHMYLEPWEMLVQGHQEIINLEFGDFFHIPVVRNSIISKEIRLWRKRSKVKFVNPVFERLNVEDGMDVQAVIYSGGERDRDETLTLLEDWKANEPTVNDPYYYQACLLLSEGKYEEFLRVSSHYMFIEPNDSMPSVMNRYYYAMVELCHKKRVKPTLQNINLCLCAKPLMAEFWCLIGDVYYHLIHDFDKAKQFYQNAIILGRHRLKSDKWPMDVAKYNTYPTKMIESCDKILESSGLYQGVQFNDMA